MEQDLATLQVIISETLKEYSHASQRTLAKKRQIPDEPRMEMFKEGNVVIRKIQIL